MTTNYTVECNSADEFIKRINPVLCNDFLGNYQLPGNDTELINSDESNWVFRGQGESSWKLLSTLDRNFSDDMKIFNERFSVDFDFLRNEQNLSEDQIYRTVELFMVIKDFVRVADRSGLPLPDDLPEFRVIGFDTTSIENRYLRDPDYLDRKWPPVEMISLFALAQHHGGLTSLLDWSYSPFVAAYFAASGAAQWFYENHKESPTDARGKRLSVWCLNRPLLARVESALLSSSETRFIHPRYAVNPNLKAQQGLFTNDTSSVPHKPLEDVIVNHFKEIHRLIVDAEAQGKGTRDLLVIENDIKHLIQNITVPVSCAGEVMRLLHLMRVDASTIYPGFDGVVKSLKEKTYWSTRATKTRLVVFPDRR